MLEEEEEDEELVPVAEADELLVLVLSMPRESQISLRVLCVAGQGVSLDH